MNFKWEKKNSAARISSLVFPLSPSRLVTSIRQLPEIAQKAAGSSVLGRHWIPCWDLLWWSCTWSLAGGEKAQLSNVCRGRLPLAFVITGMAYRHHAFKSLLTSVNPYGGRNFRNAPCGRNSHWRTGFLWVLPVIHHISLCWSAALFMLSQPYFFHMKHLVQLVQCHRL